MVGDRFTIKLVNFTNWFVVFLYGLTVSR